tara:strand:+ start:43 stop:414 length:372 start_codon:yes stop_codon:yes gene_type:complete
MDLFKRVVFYFIGCSLGSIIVYFIWKGKNVSFDYGMDARTLKSIRTKKLVFSENSYVSMKKSIIDSTAVLFILSNGDVDFGKSNQHKKPCPEYAVSGYYKEKMIECWITRCDSVATIESISVK